MKFFTDLSKREKTLIYILTLLLILFVYLNFFRSLFLDAKNLKAASYISKADYDILLEKYDKEKSNFDDNSLYIEKIEADSNHFGKNLDLEKLSQEDTFNITSFNISNVMMDKRENINVFYIDKSIFISDTLENIESFLSLITTNDNLYLRDLNLNRLDENTFDATITVREYTLKEIPYTGINYKYKNDSDKTLENGEDSLLSALYSKEEREMHADATNSSKSTSSSKTKKVDEPVKEVQNTEVEEVLNDNIEIEIEETNPYDFIDDNNEIHNQNIKLMEKTFYFSSEFINTNIENLAEISNVGDLNKESTDQILEFDFMDKLILSDFDVKLEYNVYKISFELSGPKDLKGKIYFLDDNMTLYTVDFIKFIDGYENIEVYLDKTYEYPLSIQSLIIEGSVWEDIFFRNLLLYEN